MLPKELTDLYDLSRDLRTSTSSSADTVWKHVNAELWEQTHNPWLILQRTRLARWQELAKDRHFCGIVRDRAQARTAVLAAKGWFAKHHPKSPLTRIAYFSMEFGLSEALPIYSGGLGILAGDHLKAASDLGVPCVGIGILWQQGYFRQILDVQGRQVEVYPYNEPSVLPIERTLDREGEWLRIELRFPGRTIWLRVWEALIGNAKLYLLDTNDPLNAPADRGIAGELYGHGPEMRLQQEIVLGIGGWHLLEVLGLQPQVCHLNEGHAAFAVLERAHQYMQTHHCSFNTALNATRPGNLFTTHTSVDAGFDRFHPDLVAQYLGPYAEGLGISVRGLLALGQIRPTDPLNMAYLAVRGCGHVNGVSQLHAAVSRKLFAPLFPRWPEREIPIGHITNGVHQPSWQSVEADALWSRTFTSHWTRDPLGVAPRRLRTVSDRHLWIMRKEGRGHLIGYTRWRLAQQMRQRGASARAVAEAGSVLAPDVLTVGFARRFATYKRVTLLLSDPDRLERLLTDVQQPIQLIVAGKAHPRDEAGKVLVAQWAEFVQRPGVRQHAVFIEDYDMLLAKRLVQGVDLWINTPRRPWEASGTSGMKVLVNGGLNLSSLDGWWAEAHSPDIGWALQSVDDRADAEALYRLLEGEVRHAFYTRDKTGIPQGWLRRMRASMAELTNRFSSNRMVREYTEMYYLPAAEALRRRESQADVVCQWQEHLKAHWDEVRFGKMESEGRKVTVEAFLGDLDLKEVQVQLYSETQVIPMEPLVGNRFVATLPRGVDSTDFTPRIVPRNGECLVPMEASEILWQH